MDIIVDPHEIARIQGELVPRLAYDWALLTAGPEDDFNTMTIAWGTLGDMWWKPVISCYVVPSRYTYEFMEKYDNFTVSFFPAEYHDDLNTLGSISGRDCDKIAQTKLTPVAVDGGMTFEQADTTLVCQKIYTQPLDPEAIPPRTMKHFYRNMGTHTLFMGQILRVLR